MIALDDIKNSKHLSEVEQKQREGKALQKHLKGGDRIVLLDEAGKSFSSLAFAEWINKQQLSRHQAIGLYHRGTLWLFRRTLSYGRTKN